MWQFAMNHPDAFFWLGFWTIIGASASVLGVCEVAKAAITARRRAR